MCVSIWTPWSAEGFELCQPEHHEDFEGIILELNGEHRGASWRSPAMKLIHEDEGRILAQSDSPWLGSNALIFRPKAVETLGSILHSNGELLPLDVDNGNLCIYNATRVLDALDEAASTVVRFSGGRIMMVKKYEFRPHVIKNIDIFKIPNLRMSPTFVSKRFVDAWKSARLVGLEFKQVWAAN